jgi:ABC-type Zn uptake system ZnuABC Zn-binding protein ZnuA
MPEMRAGGQANQIFWSAIITFCTVAGAVWMGSAGGCDRTPEPSVAQRPLPPVQIIATTYPLADLASQVGGTFVRVEWVVEAGQSLPDVQRTPDLHSRLRSAELVVTGGAAEPWSVEGFDNPYLARQFLRLDQLPAAQNLQGASQLWLHPAVAKEFARALAVRLGQMQPRNAMHFQRGAEDAIGRIDAVLREHAPQRDASEESPRVLVLTRDWDALLAAAGVMPVLLSELHPVRLNDVYFRRLREAAATRDVQALILDVNLPQPVINEVAARTGLRIVRLDGLGTSAAAGRSTYGRILEHNLQQLRF